MLDPEPERISKVGLMARSPEGHAAKGMQIKGNEIHWVEIQEHTFRNWVNEYLRPLGLSVENLSTDLCDGTRLVALVEALQKRSLRKIHKPVNHHQKLENVTRALDAISADGVKLVNIGNVDIVNGNLKLILGLIWSLIVRYQIGPSKFPPKKLMLAWLRSALPDTHINNFTTDWNSGVNLSALVDYCRPGLIPHWKQLDPRDAEANCRSAMEIAKRELGVPVVLDPEYLASRHLDELSGMTYVSYFMKENGPGYRSTLNWVRNQLPDRYISNFTTDWNNGQYLSELVRSLGGPVPGLDNLSTEPEHWESNLTIAIKGGEKLGVTPILRPKDMADPGVDHLGVMAYVSSFQWLPARSPPGQRVSVTWETNIYRKGEQVSFDINMLEDDVHFREITVEIMGPYGKVDCRVQNVSNSLSRGSFTANDIGFHEIVVKYQGEPVQGSPLKCKVVPQISEIRHTGLAPCAVGSVVEVSVNPQDSSPAGAKLELMEVTALSPTGKSSLCEVNKVSSGFAATFKPDEPGEWKVIVKYKGKEIQGSPFPCFVYDPNGIVLDTLEGALPGLPFAFICDSRGTGGLGEVDVDVTYEGRSIPFTTEFMADGVKRIHLPVLDGGKHRVHVYFNGHEIRGSPFSLRVGSSRSRRKKDPISNWHGKTRSFDSSVTNKYTDYLKNMETKHASSSSLDETSMSTKEKKEYHLSSGSNSKLDKVDSNEMSDSIDAVHSRLKQSGHISNIYNITSSRLNGTARDRSESPRSSSGKFSPKPSENLYSSSSALKNISNATWDHHNKSLESMNAQSSSAKRSVSRQQEQSSTYHHQSDNYSANTNVLHNKKKSTSKLNMNGYGAHSPQNGDHHGDLVVDGDGLGVVPIHSHANVTITSEFGLTPLENVEVDIIGPSGQMPVKTTAQGSSISAKYVPKEIGDHMIHIKLKNREIDGSPFRAAVFNPNAIRINRVPNGVVGRPVEIDIDGRGAGPGHLAILVDGGRVTSQVKALGDHRFRAVFLPHDPGPHAVDMTFNGLPVPGSPWRVNVVDRSESVMEASIDTRTKEMDDSVVIKGDSVRHFRYGKAARFEIIAKDYAREAIEVTVLNPAKKPMSYRLLDDSTVGHFTIEFTPSEVGTYYADINVAGKRLSAVAKVYNASLIRVLDITPGVVGQTTQFKVDASQAGEGQLEISINDGELPNQVRVLGGGCCLVSFTPEQAKPHAIEIKFNGETIPGCPLVCQVADTRQVAVSLSRLELVPVHQVSRFHIAVDGSSSAELAVSVKGPSGADLPVKVSGSVRSGFTAEFTPHEVGQHSITVHHNGTPAPGTPFVAKAYDAKRVYVSPVPRGALGRSIQFTVDASQAGEGNLEITIGAKGRNVPTQVHPQGGARFSVSFVPLEPVDHTVTVTFNKEPVPGSPYVASVSTDPGQVVVSGPGLASTPVGKTAHFTLNNVHSSLDDVEVSVEGPGGISVPAQVLEKSSNTFGVEFNPKMAGEHRIAVMLKRTPVPGSPFACKVYDVNAIKVKDTDQGYVGKPVTFLVETSQAGPGNLEVTVNGGQVPTSAQAQGSHTYAISFTPKEAKPHLIELRFNGENIPGSPFKCEVVDASKVSITGDGLEKVPVGRRAIFTVEPEAKLGTPEIKISGPMKKAIHPTIQMPSENRYMIEYLPTDVGDHNIEVMVGGQHVPGSPFLVKAYDSSKVKVLDISPGVKGKPVYFSIDASQAGAGNLEIIVSVGGRNVPNYVQAEGNAKFKVNFRPHEAAPHLLSIRFNGESVPDSPFTCKIIDKNQVMVSGAALKSSAVNQSAMITIDPQGAEVSSCNVMVLSPSGIHLPINMTGSLPKILQASFTPSEVGPHAISVSVDGEPVNGSPFNCNVYNVSKVRVSGLQDGKVGEPITFSVDASQAGEGTLELVVTTGKQSLKAEVQARSRGLYDVTFIPQEPTLHFVNITFNDQDVPGSPFECAIEESYAMLAGDMSSLHLESITETSLMQKGIVFSGLEAVVAGTTAFIDLEKKGPEAPEVTVTGPDGSSYVRVRTRTLQSGYLRAEFTPDKVGTYKVSITEGDKELMLPNPLTACVFDPLLVKLKDKPDTAVLGQEYSFRVDTTRSGLDLNDDDAIVVRIITALGEVEHYQRNLGNGLYVVSFTPTVPLCHKVHVLSQGFNAKGCPFDVIVSDHGSHNKDTVATGSGLYIARCSRSTGFTILTKGSSGRDFDVVVSGPGGVAVPVRCYQQRDGNLRAEFAPNIPGIHDVAVYYKSKMVKGSPFSCHVYDPQKILIGSTPTSVTVGNSVVISVDAAESGNALLEGDVTGPEGLTRPIFPEERFGESILRFTPKRAGKYKMMIYYGNEPVPGCPICFQAEEAGAAKAEGSGLHGAHVGTPAVFHIFGPGLPGIPSVMVEGPDSVAKCDLKKATTSADKDSGHFQASYVPTEIGVFDVRVTWAGVDIPGSPFHPRVVDSSRLRVIGGWEAHCDLSPGESVHSNGQNIQMVAGEERKIAFNTVDAGPGLMEVKLESQNRDDNVNLEDFCRIESTVAGRCKLILCPKKAGEYRLNLKWGHYPVEGAPQYLTVHPPLEGEYDGPVILSGAGMVSGRCGEETFFTIDAAQAGHGSPQVSLHSADMDVPVTVQPLGGGIYKAMYIAKVPSTYELNVSWGGKPVQGSPAIVQIGALGDASKVICTGDGLRVGTVGKDIRSFIDTRRAGAGELTAQCMGPRKTAYCELYDHGDGTFTLNIRPQESGKHALAVKYSGEHVPGSPFNLKVVGLPDPSKVKVYGPGIEHGVLATFQSRFICDTRGAGAGQLTVRVRGPKGAFRVEMQRESQKDRTIMCKYDPTEPGDYRVEVRWAGEHVPGSPFSVMIFDTQEELHRYLQGGSPGPHAQSDFYGSTGYSMGQMSWRGSQAQL